MSEAPTPPEQTPADDSSQGFLPIVLGGAIFAIAIVGLAIALGLTHELPRPGSVRTSPAPGPASVVGRDEGNSTH